MSNLVKAVPPGWKRRGLGHRPLGTKFAAERHILARLEANQLDLPAEPLPEVQNGLAIPIDDQGGAGTCFPFSIRRNVRWTMFVADQGKTSSSANEVGTVSVPPGLAVKPYYRRICEAQGQIADLGTDPVVGMRELAQWGFCKNSDDPYTDVLAKLLEPVNADVAVAAWDEQDPDGLDWAFVDADTQSDLLKLILRVLSSGRMISGCWQVSNDFCDGNFDPQKPLKPMVTDIAGGHAMNISGFASDPTTGGLYLWDDNQWSQQFGIRGRVKFTPEAVLSGSHFVTMVKPPKVVW